MFHAKYLDINKIGDLKFKGSLAPCFICQGKKKNQFQRVSRSFFKDLFIHVFYVHERSIFMHIRMGNQIPL